MKLIICEKYYVAQDVAAALGCPTRLASAFTNATSLTVAWLDGHMSALAPPEMYNPAWASRDVFPVIPATFQYLPRSKGCEAQMRALKVLVNKSAEVVNACDPGREGELIFWLFWDFIGSPTKKVYRMWLHANTLDGIKAAWLDLKDGGTSDRLAVASAGKVRSQADWLLGINGSRAITKLLGARVWSIGRVQTAILSLIAQRELTIREFRSRPYYSLYAKFDGVDTYEARMFVLPGMKKFGKFSHIFELDAEADIADVIFKRTSSEQWAVKDTTKRCRINPPALFDLMSLQKFCAGVLGWPASRTLAAAQEAYATAKTITYPRTDSTFLPEAFITSVDTLYVDVWKQVREEVERLDVLDVPKPSEAVGDKTTSTFNDTKVRDHYAIIPTGIAPVEFESDAFLIWRMVSRRFIQHFFPAAEYDSFTRETSLNYTLPIRIGMYNIGDPLPLVGITTADGLCKQGWLDAASALSLPIPETIPRERRLPKPETFAKFDKTEVYQGYTDPPDNYTEETLLGAMDRLGLGTPSTQAGIIDTLMQRGYTKRQTGRPPTIRITADGELLITALKAQKLLLQFDPEVTAEWEEKLRLIESQDPAAPTPLGFLKDITEVVNDICSVCTGVKEVYCPISKKLVTEKGNGFYFPGVPNILPKILAGRAMSALEYRNILASSKAVGPFEDFTSKTGKQFKAKLKYDSGTAKLLFSFK